MARRTKQELNELCTKFNVNTLWSWSRYHTYKTDKYEYYLKYILHEKEDRTNGIYAVSGGYCHDIIESFYSKKIKYKDMIDRYEDSLLDMNLAELKYDRSDSEKNEKIANKYENCIRHFFKNHNVINYPNKIEHFITIKISDDIIMQGYVDFLYIEPYTDENGNKKKKLYVVDWKTSTRYSGEKIDKECGQLLLYSEGIRQALNIPLEDIICEWNFLKYVTVTFEQANGKMKERYIERNSIGESLVNTAKMWLKKLGYEDDIDTYVEDMILNNSINELPNDVKEKFKIQDCFVQVELTEEKIENLKQDIINTVSEINDKENEYKTLKDERIFWQDVTDADAFRLNVLSGYSRSKHKPYNEYLKAQEMFKNDTEDNSEENKEDDDLLAFLDNL